MLDVHRGVDVDAGVEQFFDVLVAALVPAARGIEVGQFVHQRHLGLAREQGVEVEFFQQAAAIIDAAARQQRQALHQGLGFGAAVGFHQAHHHVHALPVQLTGGVEHGVGLADTGRRAQEHLELAAALALQRA